MKTDRRKPPVTPDEKRVHMTLRVKRALYDRMRCMSMAKGYLSVAEWARSIVIAAIEK